MIIGECIQSQLTHTLWCVYVWIRGLCLLCTESCCLFENGGNGWIFSVLLVFPTSWTKKRCLTGQDGLFVVSARLPVYTQLWFLGPVCIWYRETWPMIRALFLPPPLWKHSVDHLGELAFYWSGGVVIFFADRRPAGGCKWGQRVKAGRTGYLTAAILNVCIVTGIFTHVRQTTSSCLLSYQTHVNPSDIHVTHTGPSVCSNADLHLTVKPWNVCSRAEIPPGRTGGCAIWYRSWEIRYNAWILLCCMMIHDTLVSLPPGSCWYRFSVLQMWIDKFYLNLSPDPHKWESGRYCKIYI